MNEDKIFKWNILDYSDTKVIKSNQIFMSFLLETTTRIILRIYFHLNKT